jgi:hypothetical protein
MMEDRQAAHRSMLLDVPDDTIVEHLYSDSWEVSETTLEDGLQAGQRAPALAWEMLGGTSTDSSSDLVYSHGPYSSVSC